MSTSINRNNEDKKREIFQEFIEKNKKKKSSSTKVKMKKVKSLREKTLFFFQNIWLFG